MTAIEPNVAVVDPTGDSGWDALSSQFDGANVFHSAAWARVLKDSYGYTPVYLVAGSGGNDASALLPLMEVKSWLTGTRGVSLPFTDECNLLASDERAAQLVSEHARRLGKERRWKSVELRGWAGAPPAVRTNGASFVGHELDLRAGERALLEKIASPVRRAIRKAEREATVVRIERTPLALRSYYSLHCLTRKRHGLPPQPWSFFANIQRHLIHMNGGFVALSYWRDRPVAGAVFLCRGRHAIYKYGASNLAFQNLRANNLVMWEAIRWLIQNGFETLSFGRTSVQNDGLRRFKLGWGTSEYPINYQKFDFRKNGLIAEVDEAYGLHNAIFSRLPIWLSRLAGALLYRHWA